MNATLAVPGQAPITQVSSAEGVSSTTSVAACLPLVLNDQVCPLCTDGVFS